MTDNSLTEQCDSGSISDNRRRATFIAILLFLAVLSLFSSTASHDFVNFDDDEYIYNNQYVIQGLTIRGVSWAVTATHAANWHPLTWLSHMLDVQLFGLNPAGHHLMNVALHGSNGVLLFLLLFRLTGTLWRSATVAALFALHPLHVESVAWVAERKDLLSTVFALSTMHFYTSYVRSGGKGWYTATIGSYLLGLMAKPMLVTLPLLLLLLDYWPLGRMGGKLLRPELRPLLQEKAPLFAAALCSAMITVYAQSKGGALVPVADTPLGARILNALVSYLQYLIMTCWPTGLAVFYPFPADIQLWKPLLALGFLALVTGSVIYCHKERPWLITGWLWYLISLLPVIGIVTVGSQSMADRYTYLTLTGIFIIAVWLGNELIPHRGYWQATTAAAIVACCSLLTWHQLTYWKDSISLNRRALAVSSNNFIAENNLGAALDKDGSYDEALLHFGEAIRIAPWFAKSYVNMAETLRKTGRIAEGLALVKTALQLQPGFLHALDETGSLQLQSGRPSEALAAYQEMLAGDPGSAGTLLKIGIASGSMGDSAAAINAYRRSLKINPESSECLFNLAVELDRSGRPEEADEQFDAAVRYAPHPAAFIARRGVYLRSKGDFPAATALLKKAVLLEPTLAVAHNELAKLLLLQRRSDAALGYLLETLRLNPSLPDAHYNLGLIYRSKGRYDNALDHFRAAARLKPAEVDYRFNLGMELARKELLHESAVEFAEVIRLDPDGETARLARQMLADTRSTAR